MFESAKWISATRREKEDGSWLLRKTIKAPERFESAVLYVVMLGYGIMKIDGKPVTDNVLTTPYTEYDKTVLYSTFDVTDKFTGGKESVISAHLGNGMYNDVAVHWDFHCATWRHHPKMIAQIEFTLPGDKVEIFTTDSSWKTAPGPCVYNHSREGETYDARLEIPGWENLGFDDSEYVNALICRSPGGALKPDIYTPIRVVKQLKPVSKDGDIYDFGEGISGWARISATGSAGTEIKMEYAELVNGQEVHQHINHFLNVYNSPHVNHDTYIMKGEGRESYAPAFCYHGFRYVKVTGAPEDFEIIAEVVHTDFEVIGSFECSDEMLNKIHEASVRSTLTNFVSIPTDCPHREQNGWTGDAYCSCQQALMNFDMLPAYDKWIGDIRDCQRLTGQIPSIVPAGGWGYNWGSGPGWDASMMLMPWHIYQNTGDTSIIRKTWENMKLYMKYISTMADNYIVNFGLGDWCVPKDCNLCGTDITDTAFYYVFAVTMAKYARVLGEPGEEYAVLAKEIRAAFREKYFGREDLLKKQTYLACIIYQGLCNEDEIPGYLELLVQLIKDNDYHFDCGIFGIKFIYSILSENGYADLAYKATVNPTCPSYAYWINQGFNTLCENWEINNSCNHHMYSEVDHWFYRHLAGIHLDENGILIKPCFVVDWVRAKHREIEVFWDSEKICITVPKPSTLEMDGKVIPLKVGYNEIER